MKMVKVGIERLSEYLDLFKNKRVGLITNPTGVNHELKSTVDILNELTNLVALYSPEHGVRGDLQAGVRLDNYVDPVTGIMVYSLYGKNKKPTKEMLDEIDILCFDIQGVGARFYTFLYTMAYSMQACKEHHVPMVIFDRPNPVNANTVEGNILNTTYRSFVGYYPLPQRYGLTVGELAMFFNQEFEIHADVTVIAMQNYKRDMDYNDTGRNWILPSPNIPTVETTYLYLGTCIFEGTNLSEGRGTAIPFKVIGSPYLKNNLIISEINKYQLPGVKFRPIFFTPTFSKHANVLCKGIELILTDKLLFEPVKTGFILLDLIKRHHEEFDYIPPFTKGGHRFIDLISGDDFVRKDSLSIDEILEKIKQDSKEFAIKKRRYHIYDWL